MTGRVVVVGSANADLVVRTPRHPTPGETILGSSFARIRGGKGANQAVAAARAGAMVVMIGRVGADDNGADARSGLSDAGVDVSWVGTCRHDPTGVALITVSDAGENTIVVVPGANALLREVHIDDAISGGALEGGGVLLAQLEVPVAVVAHALQEARARGVTTVLNAAPAHAVDVDVLRLVDVLVVNEHEWAPIEANAVAAGVDTVVQTLGADGARWWGGRGSGTVPSPAVEVVDTTGAGDAFCGHLAAGLAAALPFETCVRRAVAAGSLACTATGAQPSLPTDAVVDQVLHGQP